MIRFFGIYKIYSIKIYNSFIKCLAATDWKIKKGFLIRQNLPTLHVANINADFVIINELDNYLKK